MGLFKQNVMDNNLLLYIMYFSIGIMGCLANMVGKIASMNAKAKAAKESFSIRQYLEDDKWLIIGNFVAIFLLMYFVKDLRDAIEKLWIVKALFACMGYAGSDLAHRAFSSANSKLNKIIDEKTK